MATRWINWSLKCKVQQLEKQMTTQQPNKTFQKTQQIGKSKMPNLSYFCDFMSLNAKDRVCLFFSVCPLWVITLASGTWLLLLLMEKKVGNPTLPVCCVQFSEYLCILRHVKSHMSLLVGCVFCQNGEWLYFLNWLRLLCFALQGQRHHKKSTSNNVLQWRFI